MEKSNFKFPMLTEAVVSGNRVIVVGRAEYYSVGVFRNYMIQDKKRFEQKSLDFNFCNWISENELGQKLKDEKDKEKNI